MHPRLKPFMFALATVTLTLGTVSRSAADILDLTTNGSQGFINGALFQQGSVQPAGTGVYNSFLRIQANGSEQGYNTNYRPVEFNELTDPHTHAIQVGDVPLVNINGVLYRQFSLDINQSHGNDTSLLSLDKLQVFLGSAPDLHGYPNLGTKIYDLGDNYVKLLDLLSHGSGMSDMYLNIPDSAFSGSDQYVYLYSLFGLNNQSNDGYEEWATDTTLSAVPEPSSIVLLGFGAAGIGATCWRRWHAKPER